MNLEIDKNLVGHRVILETVSGNNVEGDVHHVDPNGSKMSLKNAIVVGKGTKLPELYRLFAKDIISIASADGGSPSLKKQVTSPSCMKSSPSETGLPVLTPSPQRTNTIKQLPSESNGKINSSPSSNERNKIQPLMLRKNLPFHIKVLNNNVRTDVLTNQVPRTPNGNEASSPSSSPNYTIIDQIDELYSSVIDHLEKETVIGLSMEGVRVGRFGVICWIGTATSQHVFLWDMCSLGSPGITEGLSKILTDPKILKITHDCRYMSDAFLHKYNVKLENVFDTQVAASVVELRKFGAFNKFVNPLTRCLNEYLNIPIESMFCQRVRVGHEKEDESIWKQRPLPQHLIEGAVFNVFHLKNLRLALMETLLREVNIGTSLYLKDVSLVEDDLVAEKGPVAHLIPMSFKQLTSQNNKPDGEEFKSFVANGCDPYVSFTRHIPHVRRN